MALSMKQMALLTSFFGICSFLCGVIAENKKPAAGTPIHGKGVVICKYPSDPTVVLGYISFAALIVSTVVGYMSVFYPYEKRTIPYSALFRSPTMLVFFNVAWLTAGLAAALLLWPTISEQLYLTHTVHKNPAYTCPTAKTGILGGGAFVSLDSCLFWLICLMLANNARIDYFEEVDGSGKQEEHTQVANIDGNPLGLDALKHVNVV
ncbi:Receptor-transporting protein 1 [Bienertia sinuspersici]